MKIRRLLLPLGLLFLTIPALGQSAADPESRFGQAFTGYEIRPGIMLIVRQTRNGKPVQVAIQRFAGVGSVNYFGSTLYPSEVKQIIDELVPEKERGIRPDRRIPSSCAGMVCEVTYNYERVTIHLLTSVNNPKDCQNGRALIEADTNPNNEFFSAELILIDWKNPEV